MIGGSPNGKYKHNTYDNLMGSRQSLHDTIMLNCIKERTQVLPDGVTVMDQLVEIEKSKDQKGTITIFFKTHNPKQIDMETVYVMVRDDAII